MRIQVSALITLATCLGCCETATTPQNELCACVAGGSFNCAGEIVEECQDGQWAYSSNCLKGEICMLEKCSGGVCRGAKCVAKTSECAVLATYDGNSVFAGELPPIRMGMCMEGDGIPPPKNECGLTKKPTLKRELSVAAPICAQSKQDFSKVFGVDVYANPVWSGLSCTEAVPKGKFGQWYLRGFIVKKTAFLWAADIIAGPSRLAGTAVVTEWSYQPELSIGDRCPVNPKPMNELLKAMRHPRQLCMSGVEACPVCGPR